MVANKRTQIAIMPELFKELHAFALEKHGFIHGAIKFEVETAIRNHIQSKLEIRNPKKDKVNQ